VAIWRPIRIVSDTRLPAQKSDYSLYAFPLQEGEVTIEVRLLYRRAYWQLAAWKDWNDPDILMAQQVLTTIAGTSEVTNESLTLNGN
jgi:hypothetical protein